jgi:septal ring factor EnvC (AmiA/AmiB activator)
MVTSMVICDTMSAFLNSVKAYLGSHPRPRNHVRSFIMAKEDRSLSLRNEIQDLKEEAAALADRAKRTARQAEVLAKRIKHLESQLAAKR